MKKIFFLILFLSLCSSVSAEEFYVTANGSGNRDGTSWTNAWSWTQLNDSNNWATSDMAGKIDADDTVYISGSTTSQQYPGPLKIHASGSQGHPITIKAGQDQEHNGVVIIQNSATYNVSFEGHHWITVDGEYSGSPHILNRNAGTSGFYSTSSTGLVIRYCTITNWNANGVTSTDAVKFKNSTSGCEIAYCEIYSPTFGVGVDAIHIYGGTAAFGSNSVHHCNIYDLPDDGINSGHGLDVYDNIIDAQNPTLRGYGHPDGLAFQAPDGAKYIRIWNNNIKNFANSLMFVEGFADVHHIQVFNNIFEFTTKVDNAWDGVSIYLLADESGNEIESVLIANNLFLDIPAVALEVKNLKVGGSIISAVIRNNIFINNNCSTKSNSGSVGIKSDVLDVVFDENISFAGDDGNEGIGWNGTLHSVSEYNSSFGTVNSNAMPNFKAYVKYSSARDLHLNEGDTKAVDKGLDLSDSFLTDKDGVQRPVGPKWDIGPYEYSSSLAPPRNLRIVSSQ